MKYILLALLFVGVGCSSQGGEFPGELNTAPKPITVTAIGPEGVLIIDGNGKLYSYGETFYFAQTLISSGVKVGDVLSPNQTLKQTE